MNVDFAHPAWLWLLPAALAWVLWLASTSDNSISASRRYLATALRLAVTTAIVLAIAGLQWLRPIDSMTVFFALDRSDSVPGVQQEIARNWIDRVAGDKQEHDRAGLILFGNEAAIESSPTTQLDLSSMRTVITTDRTDIGAAIQLATAAFPETGQRRIVLLSDGNENLGDAGAAASSAAALNVSIDVVPLEPWRGPDVAIQRVHLPPAIQQGQTFEVRIFVHADQPGPATFRLHRNEQIQGQQTLDLMAGRNLLAFPQRLDDPGFYIYDVQLEAPHDTVPQNNRGLAFTHIHGLPRILLASSDLQADQPLTDAIRSPATDLHLIPVSRFPDTLAELQSYDAILLANVSAGDLDPESQKFLERAVRDFGTGLVCIGGDRTYTAGGYQNTPLETLLPVHMDLSSRKVLPPGALMLVIDKSGSMTGEPIEMAIQAAMGSVQLLSDRDYVGVLAFDAAPYVVAEMQPAANRAQIIRRIAEIGAGGGTVMYPAMKQAMAMLDPVAASLKHCVILTDGISAPGDFESLTESMVEQRITVSTIGLGRNIDAPLLERIAHIGRGRFHHVLSPQDVPHIFIQETAYMMGTAIVEEPFQPRLALSTEPIRGFTATPFPALLGYVATEPKARAETPLITTRGDPLLAHWQYGLGRTVAFTSDARARWAANWLGWERYAAFWQQLVSWSLRRQDHANLIAETRLDAGHGTVSVVALDDAGRYRDFLQLEAAIAGPDGRHETLALRQTGPGHYETRFPVHSPGVYLANIRLLEHGEIRASQVTGAALSYSPEFEARHPNLHLLHHLAASTGGAVIDLNATRSNPFHRDRHRTWQSIDLWPRLLRAALLLFVIDVAVRRVQLDPEELRRAWSVVRRFIPFLRAQPVLIESNTSLAALLARRNHVRASHPEPSGAPRPFSNMPEPPRSSAVHTRPGPAPSSPNVAGHSPEPGSTASRLLAARRRARDGKK